MVLFHSRLLFWRSCFIVDDLQGGFVDLETGQVFGDETGNKSSDDDESNNGDNGRGSDKADDDDVDDDDDDDGDGDDDDDDDDDKKSEKKSKDNKEFEESVGKKTTLGYVVSLLSECLAFHFISKCSFLRHL